MSPSPTAEALPNLTQAGAELYWYLEGVLFASGLDKAGQDRIKASLLTKLPAVEAEARASLRAELRYRLLNIPANETTVYWTAGPLKGTTTTSYAIDRDAALAALLAQGSDSQPARTE